MAAGAVQPPQPLGGVAEGGVGHCVAASQALKPWALWWGSRWVGMALLSYGQPGAVAKDVMGLTVGGWPLAVLDPIAAGEKECFSFL